MVVTGAGAATDGDPAQRETQADYTDLCGLALHLGPIWLGKPVQGQT